MKKDIAIPGLALVGGLAGFGLRKWQLASAFHPETGLFTHGAPATYALVGLLLLLLLCFPLLLRGELHKPGDFLPAFHCPQPGYMTILTSGAALFFVAGLLGLKEGLQLLQLWQSTSPLERDPTQLTIFAAHMLTALLSLASGAAVVFMGQSTYRGTMPQNLGRLAPLPAFAALVWLFSTHLAHGTEPVFLRYVFSLAAAALFMLAHYYIAGFLFGRLRPRLALCFALSGIVFGLTSLADGLSLGTCVLTIAFVLSSLGFSHALLGNCFGPAWPPAAAQDAPDQDENCTQ